MAGRWRTTVLMLLLLLPVVSTVACAGDEDGANAPVSTTTVTASTDVRTAPERLPGPPVPGRVVVEEGPFTDRLELDELTFTPGEVPVVTARALVVTDVSDLLALEAVVDFYDAEGQLVGSGRTVLADDHEEAVPVAGPAPPPEPVVLEVRADAPAPTAVTGLLSVPTLVNE